MAEGKKIFADKIRMIAKSIYNAADDIAGNTEGVVRISVSFDVNTEMFDTEIPTYTVEREHYPEQVLLDAYVRARNAAVEAQVISAKVINDENFTPFFKVEPEELENG